LTFYNKVILIGNLAKDPDSRYTPSGSPVTRLALVIESDARSQGASDRQIIDVIAFGKDPYQQSRSLSKGFWVLVEGKIQTRSWETLEGQKRSKLELIAERICPLRDEKRMKS
jgi:single-strand DNA-binding protein